MWHQVSRRESGEARKEDIQTLIRIQESGDRMMEITFDWIQFYSTTAGVFAGVLLLIIISAIMTALGVNKTPREIHHHYWDDECESCPTKCKYDAEV
jgi:uncharacterized membrane protein